MFTVIGRVRLKPGREEEALAPIAAGGIAIVQGMAGSAGGYWARTLTDGETTQHSFWLFDTEPDARGAEATFNSLPDLPDAPAEFISVDVCEVTGRRETGRPLFRGPDGRRSGVEAAADRRATRCSAYGEQRGAHRRLVRLGHGLRCPWARPPTSSPPGEGR